MVVEADITAPSMEAAEFSPLATALRETLLTER